MKQFKLIDNILKQYEKKINKQNLSKINIYLKPLLYHIQKNNKTYMLFFKQKIVNFDTNTNNLFLFSHSNVNKETFIDIYTKILKTYNALRRFVYLYKKSKYETVIETDLLLNTIKANSKNILCIIQNQKKYLFNIFELLKIIYNSLSNSEFFFSQPQEIKNPYNNLKFEYHNLCNIYFFMKFQWVRFNDIFDRYFKCDFDRELFLHKNFNYLRECSIKNYVYNNNENNYLYIEIMNMIINYNNKIAKRYRILINEEFPMDILYNIMKKYVYLYISAWYSYVEYETESFLKELNHRLFYFQKYNPQFGRLKYKIMRKYCFKKKQIIIKTFKTFDVKHINFMSNLNMNFDGHYKYIKLQRSYIRNYMVAKNRNIKTMDDDTNDVMDDIMDDDVDDIMDDIMDDDTDDIMDDDISIS